MIKNDRLEKNLDTLRNIIPKKPTVHTTDYPRTISEGLVKYYRQSALNVLETNTFNLSKLNWPLPLWVDPEDIKIGYWNTYRYKKFFNSWDKRIKFNGFKDFDWLNVPVLANILSAHNIDHMVINIFEVNIQFVEKKFLKNPLLGRKQDIVKEIFKVYKLGYWNSCITSLFPIVDFVVRQLLKTTNLTKSINEICNLFRECGFGVDTVNYLMPHTALTQFIYEGYEEGSGAKAFQKINSPEYLELLGKVEKNRFGVIGPALSSFLVFSNSYYGYYKEEVNASNILNRHAILHGSVDAYNTKLNTVKLITYLFLILELEPILQILFDDN